MRKILFVLLAISSSFLCFSQQDSLQKKHPRLVLFEKVAIFGMDFHNRLWLGFGGPQLLFKINQDLKIGPAYYPLWWDYANGEWDTKLGVGVRADIKRVVIGFNTFRVRETWVGSIGCGYKF